MRPFMRDCAKNPPQTSTVNDHCREGTQPPNVRDIAHRIILLVNLGLGTYNRRYVDFSFQHLAIDRFDGVAAADNQLLGRFYKGKGYRWPNPVPQRSKALVV
jgi:hypothetical protein